MPLTAAALIQPAGELPADLLPPTLEEAAAGTTARAKLEAALGAAEPPAGWLGEAAGLAPESEAAQRAWAYHRAYHARYLLALQTPATTDVEGEGSVQYLVSQINQWLQLASQKRAEFERLVAAGAPQPVGTVVVAARGAWG